MSQGLTADFDDDDYPLNLTLNKEGVGGLIGLLPTVAVRLGASTSTYLDFDDLTFKTSGWGTRDEQMVEVGEGRYTRSLDLSSVTGLSAGDVLSAEFSVDNGADVVGVTSDTIVLAASDERLKDIWRILGLDPAEPLTVTALSRVSGTVITQTITTVGSAVTVARV
jgi:hypothetical protein